MSWLVDVGIPTWAKWCRRCSELGEGYPSITQEGRLAEGYLPGINGQGLRVESPNAIAEAVEKAVAVYSATNPMYAQVFRDFYVMRYSYAKIRRRLSRRYSGKIVDIDDMLSAAIAAIDLLVEHPV